VVDVFSKNTTINPDMDKKIRRLVGRRAWVASLILGSNLMGSQLRAADAPEPIDAEKAFMEKFEKNSVFDEAVRKYEGWNSRDKLDWHVSIDNKISNYSGRQSLVEDYVNNKSSNPNQKVIVGSFQPIIFFAASLGKADALRKLLADEKTHVAIETALGNTPMHTAAVNSLECLKLLMGDGRLDINEHNNEGKTPLYLAMENNSSQCQAELLGNSNIRVNSRDIRGRTMLHIAVMNRDFNVIEKILALTTLPTEGSSGGYGDPKEFFNTEIEDDFGRKAVWYVNSIPENDLKTKVETCFGEHHIEVPPPVDDENSVTLPTPLFDPVIRNYSAWTKAGTGDRNDWRIGIGSNVANMDQMGTCIESYVNSKSYNPNQKAIIGASFPIIYLASCLPKADALQKLLDNYNTIVKIQTTLGNTPLHAAAINSDECLQALLRDAGLDVNEFNYAGKTPLYVAMESDNISSMKSLLGDARIEINACNGDGQTMLHVAVLNGNVKVIKKIRALAAAPEENNGQNFKPFLKDKLGKQASDYIDLIKDGKKKQDVEREFPAEWIIDLT
jgi:ankyrin repeat protein